jgi:hypothetical protein
LLPALHADHGLNFVADATIDADKLEKVFGYNVLTDGEKLGWLLNIQPVHLHSLRPSVASLPCVV